MTHRRMRIATRWSAELLAVLLLVSVIHSASAAPAKCDFTAWVEERDAAGLNVRQAPNARSRVVGVLPPTWFEKDYGDLGERVMVTVTDARNGWFRIRDAHDYSFLTERDARPTYAGEGWVHGSRLVVKSQASRGRATPSRQSKTIFELGGDQSFDSDAMVKGGRPVDCQGHWVRLEFDEHHLTQDLVAEMRIAPGARQGLPAGRFRFWVNKICAAQETTCDGLAVQDEQP